MQITMRADGKQAVVRLSGRFEFSAHREFREVMDTTAIAYANIVNPSKKSFTVNEI